MSLSAGANASSAETLRFVLDGRVVCIDRPAPTMTVLDYLREVAGRRGTKEGLRRGRLRRLYRGAGRTVARTAQRDVSRGQFLHPLPAHLDGKELVTVESLRQPSGDAHPVQQSMIDNHASQCGFCTPGFVMSLFATVLEPQRDAQSRAYARCLVRQSMPLHGLSAHHRCGDAPMELPDTRPLEPRRGAIRIAHLEALRRLAARAWPAPRCNIRASRAAHLG
jgi:xanthine dehydrogenase iron-sulfur cluster and FAD-binding subunit A